VQPNQGNPFQLPESERVTNLFEQYYIAFFLGKLLAVLPEKEHVDDHTQQPIQVNLLAHQARSRRRGNWGTAIHF
jgi:hypothetical protein